MNRRDFLKIVAPDLQTFCLGEGQHFIQQDDPSEIGQGLNNWLATL